MGQFGSALSNPNTFAPNPSGFSGSEWAARIAGDAGKGLASGLQQQGQQGQQQGGGPPIQTPQAPQISPDYFQPNSQGFPQGPRGNMFQPIQDPLRKTNNGFFGGGM